MTKRVGRNCVNTQLIVVGYSHPTVRYFLWWTKSHGSNFMSSTQLT